MDTGPLKSMETVQHLWLGHNDDAGADAAEESVVEVEVESVLYSCCCW